MKTQLTKSLKSTYVQIARQIASLERSVLSFQAGMVSAAGAVAADDTNSAIILSSRLSVVWKRLGNTIPAK
jgi:hypothetical protein